MAALLIPLALVLAGCGGNAGGDGEWQGTIEDSAGIPVVTNTGDGVWGPGSAWTVQQDLVIGEAEGAPEYQFGQIAGIDIGSDGRIYVIDQQAQEVRVFHPDGSYSHSMGKAGAGPGELSQGAGPVFVGTGDTVLVPDMMQQRVTRYTADGEPAGSYPLPMANGIAAKWMEGPDQALLQQAVVMQMPGQENVDQQNLLLRRNTAGEVVDTVLRMPIGSTVSFAGGQPSITLFESEPMWTVGPDGRLYYGVNSQYRLEAMSPDGTVERVIRKDMTRRPITESDQDEYRRIIMGLWQDQGMPPQALDMMSQALGFADSYPAYANILAGPDGTLWVQGIQTPDEVVEQGGAFDMQDMGSASWEVFDDEGRLLGTVEMPPRFMPLMFHDDAIYGILRDELDVQAAARMRVSRGEIRPGA